VDHQKTNLQNNDLPLNFACQCI